MLPIFLALYIVSFSMGIAILSLSILSFQRSGQLSFKYFSILFGGVMMLLLVDAFTLYERAFAGIFGGSMPWISAALSAAGNGIMGYMVPLLVFHLVDRSISRRGRIVSMGIAMALAGLGVIDRLVPGSALPEVGAAGLACLLVYGITVLFRNMGRIVNPRLQEFIRAFAIYASIMVALVVVQLCVEAIPHSPDIFHEYGVTKIAFFLGAAILLFVYGLRYLFMAEVKSVCSLPDHFIKKYGISPRECEIISMIVQGAGNRKIGETLFISALTVKNHIYHIYQKTGVENKIQLLNLINSPE